MGFEEKMKQIRASWRGKSVEDIEKEDAEREKNPDAFSNIRNMIQSERGNKLNKPAPQKIKRDLTEDELEKARVEQEKADREERMAAKKNRY
jgi:hypothetical protein